MFQGPVAAVIPAESIKLSNLYIDAKHCVTANIDMFYANTIKLVLT